MIDRKPYTTLSLFIPSEFFDTLEIFEKLIKMDKSIDKGTVKNSKRLMSIKIRQMILAYVNKYKPKIMEKKSIDNIDEINDLIDSHPEAGGEMTM